MTDEAREWVEEQQREFMRPAATLFLTDDKEYLGADWDGAGWYSRLSAPGYLDATDWSGPFDTEDDALQSLFDTYGE